MDQRTHRTKPKSNSCHTCTLRDVISCPDSLGEGFGDLRQHIDDVHIAAGETIFRADEPATSIYCIRSGFVKLLKDSSSCRNRIVRIVERDGVVGLEALFAATFGHTAIAMGEVTACRVAVPSLKHMMAVIPAVQLRLLESAHQALIEVETWLSEFAGGNARCRERMARLLLRLRDGGSNRIYRLSLEDTSSLLGITVETACRNLAEMTGLGLLAKGEHDASMRYYKADIAGLEKIAYGSKPAAGRTTHKRAA